jgi:hypothetical protein
MIKELSRLIKGHNKTVWDYSVNHQRCFCHVLALILGAGLSALKLSTANGPTSNKPQVFPTLPTITEKGEFVEDAAESSGEEVDPDDAPKSESKSGCDSTQEEDCEGKNKSGDNSEKKKKRSTPQVELGSR